MVNHTCLDFRFYRSCSFYLSYVLNTLDQFPPEPLRKWNKLIKQNYRCIHAEREREREFYILMKMDKISWAHGIRDEDPAFFSTDPDPARLEKYF